MAALAHKGQIIMGGDAGVTSWNGRTGSVLPIAGDYDATQINYDAQQTMKQKIDSLVTGVSSFNGRSGSVLPMAGDYDATQVNYSAQQTMKQKIDAVAGVWTSAVSCLVGDTTATITNAAITANSIIDAVVTETASGNVIAYTKIAVSSGSAVITWASALTEAVSVKIHVTNL